MVSQTSTLILAFLAASRTAYGHGAITSATGDAGGSGMALGIVPDTPRDGTRRDPFQQDTTRFQGDAAETFGETLGQGDNDPESGTQTIMDITGDQLPQVSQGGQLTMTLHQVNADGAGPFTCMINDDGTGQQWTEIPVSTNVEGNERGRNRDGNESDNPLVADIPANQQCTGTVAGQNNVCMVRCENPARNGPFGGVVPVQMADNANANANANNNANGNANANNANANNANGNANANNANANNANGNANANNANANNANNADGNANANNANAANNGNANNGNTNNNANAANNGNAVNNNANGNANTGNNAANTGNNANANNANANANTNNNNNAGDDDEDADEVDGDIPPVNANANSNNNNKRQVTDITATAQLGRRASEVAADAWAKMKLRRSRVGSFLL